MTRLDTKEAVELAVVTALLLYFDSNTVCQPLTLGILLNGLKRLRDKQMLTQEEVVIISGISIATISRIENGKVIPSYKTMRSLAKALGVPLNELREAVTTRQSSFLVTM